MVNERVTINTKIPLKDKAILMMALYDLSNQQKSFFYEETPDGIRVRTPQGQVLLVFDGTQYQIRGKTQEQGQEVVAPVLSMYQAIYVENLYIEQGFMTERIPDQDNVVQVNAWRV